MRKKIEYLTIGDACREYQVSRSHLSRILRDAEGRRQVGTRVYFPSAVVEAEIKKRRERYRPPRRFR